MNRAVNLLRSPLAWKVVKRNKGYLGEMKGSMNDMPQPSGCFNAHNSAKQRKYNAQLLIGIGFMALTIAIGQSLGVFFMNFSVPDRPSGKIDYSKLRN